MSSPAISNSTTLSADTAVGMGTLSLLRNLGLFSLALVLLAYAGVAVYRHEQIDRETELRLDRVARIAQEHALKVFDTNETILDRLMDVLGQESPAVVKSREAALHSQMVAMSRNKPQIQSMWVQGPDGHPLATDRSLPAPYSLDISDRNYFKWHQAHRGGVYFSGVMKGRSTGTAFFDMSRGRYLPDASFAGVVSVSLSPEYFEAFYKELLADEPGVAIAILRDDGTLLARQPRASVGLKQVSANSPVMSRIGKGTNEGSVIAVSSFDNRQRQFQYRKVGEYPVFVVASVETAEVQRRWLAEMGWIGAIGLPALIGLFFTGRSALQRTRESLQATQRLRQEAMARRRVEEALLQSQKLEALGRLTGGVAHDFNNALMVINTNLAIVKLKYPEMANKQVDAIGRAVKSATQLTRQLLAFSRRQALLPQTISLQQRLPALSAMLEPVLGSLVQLSLDVAPDTAQILVDPAELELALLNLAINARDAMPSGGHFQVRARNATEELPPMFQSSAVVIEATDTGTGIDPQILDKVFEPFFTTKPVGEGTGLGLSQVYGLCQRANGTATVESRPQAGTTVRMWFPPSTQAVPDTARATAELSQLGISILLVEDNDQVAFALKDILETLNCKVTRMDRAQAAYDWLESQPKLPDLMLSDIVMPGEMDGAALAAKVRARFPQLKILLMTGHAQQVQALSSSGFEILPKPCSAQLLADAIRRAAGNPSGVTAP